MTSLISIDYKTRFCRFYIDSDDDIASLPTHSNAGKDNLSTVHSCAYGSIARCQSGKTYTLDGNDIWVVLAGSSNTSDSGSTSDNDDIEEITHSEIDALF